jgi:uncharacterized protein YbjT (DUF2867 family)
MDPQNNTHDRTAAESTLIETSLERAKPAENMAPPGQLQSPARVKVILFGATGMIGAGTLLECFADPRVERVLAVVRKPTGVGHAKLEEVIHPDFYDYTALQPRWPEFDACLFCLGVTSVGMDEASYRHVTFDLTTAAARSMAAVNARLVFCYVSGAGTDGSARGRVMWARVKGETENALLALPFRGAYMFRPGYIQPMKGVRSSTRWYQAVYDVVGPLYPLLRRVAPGSVTNTATLGRALIQVAASGYPTHVLEGRDINTAGDLE